MMTIDTWKTLHIRETKFSADSVEWCPISPYQNYFVCGTYFLNETTDRNTEVEIKKQSERIGNITIFVVFKDKLEEVYTVDCPAVLDIKWAPKKVFEHIALVTANAAGEVNLFYFENNLLNFMSKCVLKEGVGDYLTLSVDWAKDDNPDLICASDSRGNVTILKVISDGLRVLNKWKAHSLEAWIVCFDSLYSNLCYSGGDEAEMKIWDIRSEEVASFKKHGAGVTALTSNLRKENNLVSGSYDETVLFWDTRNRKTTVGCIVASGGLWRLKWGPNFWSHYLLGACIYGGYQVYNADSYSVVANYNEHESLAYGADWCFLNDIELKGLLHCDHSALIATCSFYDRKLCVSLLKKFC